MEVVYYFCVYAWPHWGPVTVICAIVGSGYDSTFVGRQATTSIKD